MVTNNNLSNNHETEICILGGILIDPNVITEVSETIKPEYFSYPVFGEVFKVMRELYDGDGLDPVILRHELENRKIEVGGGKAISDWTTIAVSAYQTVRHAERLVEQWQARSLEDACYSSLDKLFGTTRISDICESLSKRIDEIATRYTTMIPSAGRIVELNRNDITISPVNTGYEALNAYFGSGFDRGSVTIIGGSTSIGKSQFALNIISRACKAEEPVKCLYVVQEMNLQSIEDRIVSTLSGVPQGACRMLRAGKAKKSTEENYAESYNIAVEEFSKLPLRVHANGTITANDFTYMVAKHHKDIDLVVLDYMQQCRASYSGQDSRERIDEISRTCKHLATKYNVAIIALAQLSRDGAKAGNQNDNGRPKLWHLKESSSIEQDADHVILLYREKAKNADSETLELDICKNRHGQTGRLNFIFDLITGIIYDPKENETNE